MFLNSALLPAPHTPFPSMTPHVPALSWHMGSAVISPRIFVQNPFHFYACCVGFCENVIYLYSKC